MKQNGNFKRLLKRMAYIIKHIFASMHGAFLLPKKDYVDAYLKDFYDHVYNDDVNMDHCSSDRANMHQDMQNIKNDFKKAVKQYREEEVIHG